MTDAAKKVHNFINYLQDNFLAKEVYYKIMKETGDSKVACKEVEEIKKQLEGRVIDEVLEKEKKDEVLKKDAIDELVEIKKVLDKKEELIEMG